MSLTLDTPLGELKRANLSPAELGELKRANLSPAA